MSSLPRGRRGVSRTVRAYSYGVRAPESMAHVAPPLIMAQIETIDGADRAGEIAAVDGIDVLFVGPADLKFAIVASGGDPETEFEPRVAAVAAAAATAGKRTGILVRDASEIERRLDQGFSMMAVDSDLAILRRGYGELIARRPRS
jgi:2-dehydro-3-deoxyglucarate aldolase/4-hydroxy-2-oxoheptanedioate aldolase